MAQALLYELISTIYETVIKYISNHIYVRLGARSFCFFVRIFNSCFISISYFLVHYQFFSRTNININEGFIQKVNPFFFKNIYLKGQFKIKINIIKSGVYIKYWYIRN